MNREETDSSEEKTDELEERIYLQGFKSSWDLKQEIRSVIDTWHEENYQVNSMFSRGPYIYLVFKEEVAK